MTKKIKTIKNQIFGGSLITIFIMIFLVAVSSLCLFLINISYNTVLENRDNQEKTQDAVIAHYGWLDSLNSTIQNGTEFTGSMDPKTCSLGKWRSSLSESDLKDEIIVKYLEELDQPHEYIHTKAAELIELSRNDKSAAYKKYSDEIKPKAEIVIAELTKISQVYRDNAAKASDSLEGLIKVSLIASLIIAFAAIIFSVLFADSTSKKISKPIIAVADWSQKMSLGNDELDFEDIDIGDGTESEISVMVDAFKKMADSIKENVNVVRKVADGDMTAFVNIRSTGDSLGKNLYKMVQSNDLLFAEILSISQTVAEASGQIAKSSQSLAGSSTSQAVSVQELSSTVNYADKLIKSNTQKTEEAVSMSNRIHSDAKISNEKFDDLLASMGEIRKSSDKISSIIKVIDDIAFQTNILALNASIEAARAGEAGKGFAVVADEVRELALKSAEAVTDSKHLIDDTIIKAQEGNRISLESVDLFKNIVNEINDIIETVSDIANASDEQLVGMEKIRKEIDQISQSAAGNAAISEESAAFSQEMSANADLLKQAMSKFNLRKRLEGQAYIPPEKQNDSKFIKKANEHYQKSIKTGKIGFELEDPTAAIDRNLN